MDWGGTQLEIGTAYPTVAQSPQQSKKPAQENPERAFINNPGGFLLSRAVARAVPSAPRGLTSVFGMGTGVALSTQPPEKRRAFSNRRFENANFGLGTLAFLRLPKLNDSTRPASKQRPK